MLLLTGGRMVLERQLMHYNADSMITVPLKVFSFPIAINDGVRNYYEKQEKITSI